MELQYYQFKVDYSGDDEYFAQREDEAA